MSVQKYEDRGPIDASAHFDPSRIVGMSVVITGGASGLGRAYAKAFSAAGAYVTIGDVDQETGSVLATELSASEQGDVQFVKCDVRVWEEQVAMFEAATKNSPNKSCDVVIANAGIAGRDDVYWLEDPTLPPVKPDLSISEVNLGGLLYTTKLAMHYFRRQELDSARERCLIIKSSLAGYLEQARTPQYCVSKFGARGLMRSLRWTTWMESVRVNLVAPWAIRTPIVEHQELLESRGMKFALEEDAAKTMLRIASDKGVNGRCLAVVPREWAPEGFMDLNQDDFKDGDPAKEWQRQVIIASQA